MTIFSPTAGWAVLYGGTFLHLAFWICIKNWFPTPFYQLNRSLRADTMGWVIGYIAFLMLMVFSWVAIGQGPEWEKAIPQDEFVYDTPFAVGLMWFNISLIFVNMIILNAYQERSKGFATDLRYVKRVEKYLEHQTPLGKYARGIFSEEDFVLINTYGSNSLTYRFDGLFSALKGIIPETLPVVIHHAVFRGFLWRFIQDDKFDVKITNLQNTSEQLDEKPKTRISISRNYTEQGVPWLTGFISNLASGSYSLQLCD